MMSDFVKTRDYYASLDEKDLCQCDDCRRFHKKVRSAYPKLSDRLEELGVDIAKPFETWAIDSGGGKILYPDVQYIVFGDRKDFKEMTIDDVKIGLAESHPYTEIGEEHFVIEVSLITLNK